MFSKDILLKLQIEMLSSALKVNLIKMVHFGNSLMITKKNKGPSNEPWGTPDLIEEHW